MKTVMPLLVALGICLVAVVTSAFFYKYFFVRYGVIFFGILLAVFVYRKLSR